MKKRSEFCTGSSLCNQRRPFSTALQIFVNIYLYVGGRAGRVLMVVMARRGRKWRSVPKEISSIRGWEKGGVVA